MGRMGAVPHWPIVWRSCASSVSSPVGSAIVYESLHAEIVAAPAIVTTHVRCRAVRRIVHLGCFVRLTNRDRQRDVMRGGADVVELGTERGDVDETATGGEHGGL